MLIDAPNPVHTTSTVKKRKKETESTHAIEELLNNADNEGYRKKKHLTNSLVAADALLSAQEQHEDNHPSTQKILGRYQHAEETLTEEEHRLPEDVEA